MVCTIWDMKIAMPIWNGRVSPVFDVAGRLVVLDIESTVRANRQEVAIGQSSVEKTKRLSELGVGVLVCGAISQSLASMIQQSGIQVISDICGPVDLVVEAFTAGRLSEPDFKMPGCCGRRHRRRGCRRGRWEFSSQRGKNT